jgi:transcriptional repressor NrdR
MRCPFCDTERDKVVDSRASDGGRSIRRRRECQACRRRFTTYEHVEQKPRLFVTKNDGTRVPYDRRKILGGLEKACYKRPISVGALNKLVDDVEEELFHRFDREVESRQIGQVLAQRLKNVDQVAYVRFASVYKQFRDLDDLLEDVRDVLESNEETPPGQGLLFRKE